MLIYSRVVDNFKRRKSEHIEFLGNEDVDRFFHFRKHYFKIHKEDTKSEQRTKRYAFLQKLSPRAD